MLKPILPVCICWFYYVSVNVRIWNALSSGYCLKLSHDSFLLHILSFHHSPSSFCSTPPAATTLVCDRCSSHVVDWYKLVVHFILEMAGSLSLFIHAFVIAEVMNESVG